MVLLTGESEAGGPRVGIVIFPISGAAAPTARSEATFSDIEPNLFPDLLALAIDTSSHSVNILGEFHSSNPV
jgi:hypothetical protein